MPQKIQSLTGLVPIPKDICIRYIIRVNIKKKRDSGFYLFIYLFLLLLLLLLLFLQVRVIMYIMLAILMGTTWLKMGQYLKLLCFLTVVVVVPNEAF